MLSKCACSLASQARLSQIDSVGLHDSCWNGLPTGQAHGCAALLFQARSMIELNQNGPVSLAERFLRSFGARTALSAVLISLSVTLGAAAAQTNAPAKPVDLTEMSLEDLMKLDVPRVYAASKIEQKTTEAPSSVTIITSDDIKKYGYRTLSDVLRSVPGFNV